MRRTIGFALAWALVLSVVATANAQNLPPGSYQGSCRNISMSGSQLSASCSDPQGRYVFSSIDANSCNGGIANRNGYLRCGNGGGAYSLPMGSYRDSCVNATIQGSILSANCTSPSGSRVYSSLNVVRCGGGNVRNLNGFLACGTGSNNGYPGGGGFLPAGSYRQSCTNAYMRGGILTASCPNPNGARLTTQLVTAGCRGGDIANINGRLACNR